MLISHKACLEKYKNNYQIKKAVEAGELFLIEKGIYSDKKYESAVSVIAMKYPNAIFTLDSAVYYHNLTDRIPDKFHLATSRGTTAIRDQRVIQVFDNSKLWDMGIEKKDINGTFVRIYSKERVLVEILRNKNKLPFDYYKEIIRNYRKIMDDLDIQAIQEYVYEAPKSKMIMELLQLEVF